MKHLMGNVPARRQFFRSMLRNVGLALLAAGGGVAVTKRRRLVREGNCLNRGICSDCGVFDECGLPRALSVRQVLARTQNGK